MTESQMEWIEDSKKYEEPEPQEYEEEDLGEIDREYEKWLDRELMKENIEEKSDKNEL